MKVFKFGGASVKDSAAVKSMTEIIRANNEGPLIVIVSAMGKTTNAIEVLLQKVIDEKDFSNEFLSLQKFHNNIMKELSLNNDETFIKEISGIYTEIEMQLNRVSSALNYDYVYDQTVSLGEILSTKIISSYLNHSGISSFWLDARKVIKTDSTHREAKIDWGATQNIIRSNVAQNINEHVIISQGFIGSNSNFNTTTLGREGSDFSAAIFGTSVKADSVTIWKDVPGVLNADPKKFEDTKKYAELPYKEAAEMTFYGASVIHPKTIKPLAQKNIPLYVKSFEDPEAKGTLIHDCIIPNLAPAIIHQDNQTVLSFKISDYSFINEHHISLIFENVNKLNLTINLMQNSAISFTICMDDNPTKREKLRKALSENFLIFYNEGLDMITVKNYNEKTINDLMKGKEVIIEQRSRNNFQMVFKA